MKPGSCNCCFQFILPDLTASVVAITLSTPVATEYSAAFLVARSLILFRFKGSAVAECIKPASAATSPVGKIEPVLPATIMSGPQPTRSLTKHGQPQAIASLTT